MSDLHNYLVAPIHTQTLIIRRCLEDTNCDVHIKESLTSPNVCDALLLLAIWKAINYDYTSILIVTHSNSLAKYITQHIQILIKYINHKNMNSDNLCGIIVQPLLTNGLPLCDMSKLEALVMLIVNLTEMF
eukprot:249477_1